MGVVPEATGVLEAVEVAVVPEAMEVLEESEATEDTADVVGNWGTATAKATAILALGTNADVASGCLSTHLGHAFQAYFHLLLMHHMPKKPRLLQNPPG